ncbi:FtsX-like permease family protein, partial [Rhizobium sp. SEMIA 4085]|uniref:ABC transporter permease n=1 Tax=Rhizobium sp. SEMIA 4085 TaxID=2137761 RepID=UPI0032B19B1C
AAFFAASPPLTLPRRCIGLLKYVPVLAPYSTRDIVLRLAFGALAMLLVWQFLFEAVARALFGGLMAILFGLVIGFTAVTLLKVPFVVSPLMIAVAFVFSAAIGMIFGYFPARRAAQLNPIEALRHE